MRPGTKHIRIGRVFRMYEELNKVILYRKLYEKKPNLSGLLETKKIIEMHFPEVIKEKIESI